MTETTLQKEADFWDKKAGEKAGYYKGLITIPDEKIYRLHKFAFSLLGDVFGKKILDIGCGMGGNSCYFAGKGADVCAMDISQNSIDKTREWCAINGVKVDARVMNCERLEFPDESFDIVFGSFILHHVDIDKASSEIRRVLCNGGKAFFIETFADNPVLMFFRDRILPVFNLRKSSPSEYPMTSEKIRRAEEKLGKAAIYCDQLIFFRLCASYFFKDAHAARALFSFIDDLLSRIKPLKKLTYYKIMEFKRK